jgi:hypothetical protein
MGSRSDVDVNGRATGGDEASFENCKKEEDEEG